MRTADLLRRSLQAEGLAQMAGADVGHVWVGWRCQSEGARPVEGIAGMTGERSNQFPDMIKSGWGLAAFQAIFTDGHLTPPELAELNHKAFDGKSAIHTIAVEVSREVCEGARSFVSEFITHPKTPFKRFGLAADAQKFEGGGCGTFGVSLLRASKLFEGTRLADLLWRKVVASSRMFGSGLRLPPETEPLPNPGAKRRKVPLLSLALGNWNPRKGDPGKSLNVMDPELLLLSFKTMYRLAFSEVSRASPAMAKSFGHSPIFRFRAVKASKNSKRIKVIDSNFDSRARQVTQETERWYSAAQFRPSLIQVEQARVLVLEKP